MSEVIYKYPIKEINVEQVFSCGAPARVLSAGLDGDGKLCVWILQQNVQRAAEIDATIVVKAIGTGWEDAINFAEWDFVGSVTKGGFVWHVFWR